MLSRSWDAVGCGIETAQPERAVFTRDNRATPARDKGKPARIRTRICEVGARRAAFTPQVCKADDPARTGLSGLAKQSVARLSRATSESASRATPKGALPAELHQQGRKRFSAQPGWR